MKSLFKIQKFFDSETPRLNYVDNNLIHEKPRNLETPSYLPYKDGVRRNYIELQTDWEQINLLEAGKHITKADKEALIQAYRDAVRKKLETNHMNVRHASDIAMIINILGNGRENFRWLVDGMTNYIRDKKISAERYRGELSLKNGVLQLEHNTSLHRTFRPQNNVNIDFPLTHTEILENLKIEKRAEVLAKKKLENLQSELPATKEVKPTSAFEQAPESKKTISNTTNVESKAEEVTQKPLESTEKISDKYGKIWKIWNTQITSDTRGYAQSSPGNIITFVSEYELQLHGLENKSVLTADDFNKIELFTVTVDGISIRAPKSFGIINDGDNFELQAIQGYYANNNHPKVKQTPMVPNDASKNDFLAEAKNPPSQGLPYNELNNMRKAGQANNDLVLADFYSLNQFLIWKIEWRLFNISSTESLPDNAIILNNTQYVIPKTPFNYIPQKEAEWNLENVLHIGTDNKWEQLFIKKDNSHLLSWNNSDNPNDNTKTQDIINRVNAESSENTHKIETAEMKQIKSIQEKIGFTGAEIDGIKGIKTESAIMGYNSRAKNGGENLEITANMTPEQIKEIQTKLGFTGSLIDGKVGIRTQSALIGYNSNKNNDTIT